MLAELSGPKNTILKHLKSSGSTSQRLKSTVDNSSMNFTKLKNYLKFLH
jgi:hypothetical protein